MLKGIVIVASGHPQYGRMAYNLAITIKAVEDFPVAVLHSGRGLAHLNDQQKGIFDYIIEIDGPESCGAKLCAYDNTPFTHTLILDADMLWLPKKTPSELFQEMEGVKFTAISEGNSDEPASHYFFWADLAEIRTKYKVDKVHQYRTEVMYFEKCKEVKAMFKDAKKIHTKPGLLTIKKFAGGVPDELSVNIAAAIHGLEPHKERWRPSYWPKLHRETVLPLAQLYAEYFLFSAGGNTAPQATQTFYNKLVKAQAPKIGRVHLFALQSKYSFLPEREKS